MGIGDLVFPGEDFAHMCELGVFALSNFSLQTSPFIAASTTNDRECAMTEILCESPPGKWVDVPITVRFGDTDPYGVVYFASYFRYCHHGIEEFLRSQGLAPQELFRNVAEGFGLPIAGASCDFLRPVWYGERLRLSVFLVQARTKAVTFGFHFYHAEGGELVARGQATMVAIDRDWQSRVLPERLRAALEPFLPPVLTS
jgi:acyl-CoA thioester hydrolase